MAQKVEAGMPASALRQRHLWVEVANDDSLGVPRGAGSDDRRIDAFLLGLVVIGALLRIWQYAANTSLWLDEILLARNIVDRSMWVLLATPLVHSQVAPKGFLLIEKIASFSLGPKDYVLRLFPLLCSLVGLVAFWQVVRRLFKGVAPLVALALFATAAPLLTFAAEVKQYSSDVAATVLLLWLCLDLAVRDVSRGRALWAGAAGAVVVWFSQPMIITVVVMGAVLALSAWRQRPELGKKKLLTLAPILSMWILSALAAGLAGLASMTPALREFMRQCWAAGLLPLPPWRALQIHWPWNQLKGLIGSGGQASLAVPYPRLYLILAAFGFLLLWKRLGTTGALVFAPVAGALAGAIARQYPFTDRLILYLLPSLFIAIAASVDWIYQRVTLWSRPLGWLVVAALMTPAIYPMATTPPPYRIEDIKPVMSYVQMNRQPGDVVYVYYGARFAFTFYSRDYGFQNNEYKIGGCHRGDGRRNLEELDLFRGQPRVWVVLTHSLPQYREREDITHYLDTIGVRRDAFSVQSRVVSHWALPAEAILYDLSDSKRLSSATAESISMTGPTSVDPLTDCGKPQETSAPHRLL